MKSQSSLWKRIQAGLREMFGSGVLWYCMIALAMLSLLIEPSFNVFSRMIHFTVLTAASAHPFDCG